MIKKLYPFVKKYNMQIVFCLLFTLVEVLCELAIPRLMAMIVDEGIPSKDLNNIFMIGLIMVLVAVVALTCGVLNAKYSSLASQGFAARLRKAMYDKSMDLSFSNIDKFSHASLITRMTSDITMLQNTGMFSLRILTRAPILLISAYAISASINFNLSLVIIVSIILLAIGTVIIVKSAGKLYTAMQKRLDNLNGTVQENLIAIRVVKAFVREKLEKKKFKKVNDELMESAIKVGHLTSLMMPMMMLILFGTTIGVIWLGGNFVGQDLMTTGDLLSFISYIMQILMSVMMFSMIIVMLTRAKACAERVIEVLETESDIKDNEDISTQQVAPRVTKGKIEFVNVSFRYNSDSEKHGDDVLTDINFTANPGEIIGIIGGTGSGKTSLINLIPRFYDVTSGNILVDGLDVRKYKQNDLRDAMGIVMQKNNLFSGSIKENILLGHKEASDEEMIRASKDAQAFDFIQKLPEKFETILEQGGTNLSGGQKQRVCIARAMLKKPPILIFDDSSSALDTATESKIKSSFYNNFKDSTVIIVAQRISSIIDADKIIVLDDGKISGMGTHSELVEQNEIYKEICNSQLQGGVAS